MSELPDVLDGALCALRNSGYEKDADELLALWNRRHHPSPQGVRVPDAIDAEPTNTQHYADGWNDCREEVLRLNPQPAAELSIHNDISSKLTVEQPGAVVGDVNDAARKAREVRARRSGALTEMEAQSLSELVRSEEVIETAYQAWRELAVAGHATNHECIAAALRTLATKDTP